MDNLWPDFKAAEDIITPKEILEKQGQYLLESTGGVVYGIVEEVAGPLTPTGMANAFVYKFSIKSKFLEGYSYRLMYLSHDITIYPIKVKLDEKILNELNMKGAIWNVNLEEDFLGLLSRMFKTNRVQVVVGSLMKLSK
ncbi:hypothetical protein QNH38_22370 [Paenibacillus polymyxa]|uniref:hypothetical protein n=1 Tax=Paenibacillus polymyxa TaxID=1406 RepID=UPI001F583F8C|nr:hypothetical protein [Paenibacillus polymyxa]UNL93999.1 hypothetical protein CPY53_10795 [Paenibacillus polymyxa]WHX35255.1 hypothetical protein QNH38_22370 [Paenibacillus polymyxa]